MLSDREYSRSPYRPTWGYSPDAGRPNTISAAFLFGNPASAAHPNPALPNAPKRSSIMDVRLGGDPRGCASSAAPAPARRPVRRRRHRPEPAATTSLPPVPGSAHPERPECPSTVHFAPRTARPARGSHRRPIPQPRTVERGDVGQRRAGQPVRRLPSPEARAPDGSRRARTATGAGAPTRAGAVARPDRLHSPHHTPQIARPPRAEPNLTAQSRGCASAHCRTGRGDRSHRIDRAQWTNVCHHHGAQNGVLISG